MPASTDIATVPLRAVLRPAPILAPEDSLHRFLYNSRFLSASTLPVLEDGRLCGMVTMADILPILATPAPEERGRALNRPLAEIMRPAVAVAHPEMSVGEVGQLCASHGLDIIPVVDADGYCFGIIAATDLLLPEMPASKPAVVGGMATPFGVYLTNGSLQAGVGNGALVAAGVLMGFMMIGAYLLLWGGLWAVQHAAHLPDSPLFDIFYEPTARQPWLGLVSVGIKAAVFVVFMLLLRATRVAGYHAAEHQTVHAIERSEPLTLEIVRRMPRPHPRCGTNLMAAMVLFTSFETIFGYVPFLDDSKEVFAAIVTLFTWRTVGTFLQQWFTTRPANDRQIASGIAAGKDLLAKYNTSAPTRPNLGRRLWCMGLAQTLLGTMLVLIPTMLLLSWFWPH